MSAAGARPVTPGGLVAAGLAELVADPRLPAELHARVGELAALAGGLEPYVSAMSAPEPAHLAAVARRTGEHDWAGAAGRATLGLEQEMLSGHVEGRLLALLARAVRAATVLEIGTFTGYAALALAAALPTGGRVVTCEIDAEVAALAGDNIAGSPVGSRVDLRVGPARETLRALAGEGARFDLVFLDADKAGYADYVRDVLDLGLLAGHGLLCVDNTLMQGDPWTGPSTPNGRAIAEFNAQLAADPRLEQVVVPLRDGLTLALRTTAPHVTEEN